LTELIKNYLELWNHWVDPSRNRQLLLLICYQKMCYLFIHFCGSSFENINNVLSALSTAFACKQIAV